MKYISCIGFLIGLFLIIFSLGVTIDYVALGIVGIIGGLIILAISGTFIDSE